jgi:hypothetical protein
MFDVFCPRHGARMLLGPRRIRSLRRTELGLVAGYHCYCGHEGFELFGDRPRTRLQVPA